LTAAWSQVGYIVSTSWTAADGVSSSAWGGAASPSAAAPSFAGILALLNQALATQDPGAPAGLGNANPVLYAISASTRGTSSAAFRDVTSGNNVVPCQQGTVDCPSQPPYQYGYQAGPGYDMVTGLGSVDAHNLVAAWTGLTPTRTSLQVMPSGTAEGAPVHLAATVASNATSNAMTGSVLFYFDTLDDGGSPDLSLMATAAIAPTTSGSEGGTATAVAIAPSGFLGKARVVAFYGGDSHYLASWSQAATVATTSTLAASPPAITLQPNEQHTFTTSGGVPPVQWTIVRDTACDAKYNCSGVEALTATSGAFQAGPVDGTTLVAAIDADGAESRITVTVSGSPVDGGTLPPAWDGGGWDGGAADTGTGDDGPADAPPGDDGGAGTSDASIPADAAVEDGSASDAAAARDAPLADAGGSDSGAAADAQGSGAGGGSDGGAGGCGCAMVGRESGDGTGGALGSLMLALVAIRPRRRRAKRPAPHAGPPPSSRAAPRGTPRRPPSRARQPRAPTRPRS
jgi:hypothetical protein